MQSLKITNTERGDTIIEVLLAIAVMGSIIAGGYAIATRSLNGIRVSQERTEALKVAEAQVETIRARLREVSGRNDPDLTNTLILTPPVVATSPASRWFCTNSSGSLDILPSSLDPANLNTYGTPPNPKCVVDGRYYVAISTDGASQVAGSAAYNVPITVQVHWERAGGRGIESLNLGFKTVL